MDYPLEYVATIRVPYYDTDQRGVVWHGNYIKYFEDAREEMFRSLGFPYGEIEKQGIIMPVVDVSVRYHRPARYDDILAVKVSVAEPPRAKIKIDYEIRNGNGDLCTTGSTTLGFVSSATLLPCRPPKILLRG